MERRKAEKIMKDLKNRRTYGDDFTVRYDGKFEQVIVESNRRGKIYQGDLDHIRKVVEEHGVMLFIDFEEEWIKIHK